MSFPRVNVKQLARLIPALLAILLIIGLRLIALRSDPFPRLDWSAGLMTDEGFYIHNARNLVLFGHARTDEFNNMLLSPLLHFGQVAVFKVFGVGSVQARLISVVCSLLTLTILWAALRRAFDSRIAFTAVLFLGLDHTNLLYNRMALMDTPAALFAVMAFYAFVHSMTGERKSINQKWLWLMACGALIALTVTVRSLCIYLLAVPFVALGIQIFRRPGVGGSIPGKPERRFRTDLLALGLPAFLVFVLYFLLWYWPHHAEIMAMNHFYLAQQIQPKSLAQLCWNVYYSVLGDTRPLSPYLFRHTPLVFTLALLGLMFRPRTPAQPVESYLVAWLLLGWSMLAMISYSPSRYYVTTYPALAALAALTLWRLPELWARFQQADIRTRLLRAALTWFLVYHAVEIFLHRYRVQSRPWATVLVYGLPGAVSILDFRFSILDWLVKQLRSRVRYPQPQTAAVLTLWFLFNAYWLGGWLLGLEHTQYQMSRWLAQNVPAGSVLIGDVAPGVCLDNNFIAVHVQPGLANYVLPVETMGARYPQAPRYIIMDDRWKDRFWMVRYPELVTPERQIKLARVLQWQVGVYAVKP